MIIAGSRTITSCDIGAAVRRSKFHVTSVLSGEARGVDTLGKLWAIESGIDVYLFPADWKRYGRKAGMVRNRDMAEFADALILIWDGKSPGSAAMLKIAKGRGLRIYQEVQ